METIKLVKGVKDYYCCFCGEIIPKEERHTVDRIAPWDHPENEGFSTWRSHPRCHKYGHAFYETSEGFNPHDAYPEEFKAYIEQQERK